MNLPIMLDALVKEGQQATGSLQLETKSGLRRAPQVVRQYLPPKKPKQPKDQTNLAELEEFPYVIFRYISEECDNEETLVKVKAICGAYSQDDPAGEQELFNLTDALKTHFLSKRFFGGAYEIKLPLKREIPEEQCAPEWAGWLDLIISIPNIQEVDEDVRRILGNSAD